MEKLVREEGRSRGKALTDLERIQASLFSITKSITGEWQRQEVGVKAKQRVPRTETRQRL